MKSTGTIEDETGLWYAPNTGASNESGFTGLPGGYRYSLNGSFSNLGYNGNFWSSSQDMINSAWYLSLYYDNAGLDRYPTFKDRGFSVRCLKDDFAP